MADVARPLGHLNGLMAKIAKGEFNSRVFIERDDETGTALRNLQAMQAKLGYERMEQADQLQRDIARLARERLAIAADRHPPLAFLGQRVSLAKNVVDHARAGLRANAARDPLSRPSREPTE